MKIPLRIVLVLGVLAVSACDSGSVDATRCGAAAIDCSALPGVDAQKVACVDGVCDVTNACAEGRGHCSTEVNVGCEVDLTTPSNCGACGNACDEESPACVGSPRTCGQCPSDHPTFCDNVPACVDTNTDPANCGACGNACPTQANATATCAAGICGSVCTGGTMLCNGVCATNCEFTPDAQVTAITVLRNGKVMVAGSFTSADARFVGGIGRVLFNGQYDGTFPIVAGDYEGQITSVVEERDATGAATGKLLVVGSVRWGGPGSSFGIVRLNANGTVDATFNAGGAGCDSGLITAIIPELTATGTPTTKLYLALSTGCTTYNGVGAAGLIRVDASGARDMSFNNGGSGFSNRVDSVTLEQD